MKHILTIIGTCFILFSCTKQIQVPTGGENRIVYAEGFELKDYEDYKHVIIYKPFSKEIQTQYYLVGSAETETPADGVKIVVPLSHIGVASNTHIGFLEALGLLDHVSGLCLPNSVYSPTMLRLYYEGKAIDMGDAMKIEPERAILANADAIMISGYGQGDVNPERLNQVGIKFMYNNEWTETTALGRAEWIKLVGALFCKDSLADSIFEYVDSAYNANKHIVENIENKPSIMTGNNFRGTWYMSSGNSYMASLFADAGADYYYQNDTTKGSIPLSIEQVINQFAGADVWVGSNGHSLDELAQMDEKHTWFKAFKDHKVFNFYRRTNAQNANDYWERGVVHPEELLSDLIWALYPELMTDYQPVYINQLQ